MGNDSPFSSQPSKHDPKKVYDILIASVTYSETSSLWFHLFSIPKWLASPSSDSCISAI